MFDRNVLQEMFDRAEKAGHKPYGPCTWGYFFLDPDGHALTAAGKKLSKRGYTFVGILEPEGYDETTDPLFLHVQRVEQHSLESLERLNDELAAFAREEGLMGYDGMDVGPAPESSS